MSGFCKSVDSDVQTRYNIPLLHKRESGNPVHSSPSNFHQHINTENILLIKGKDKVKQNVYKHILLLFRKKVQSLLIKENLKGGWHVNPMHWTSPSIIVKNNKLY